MHLLFYMLGIEYLKKVQVQITEITKCTHKHYSMYTRRVNSHISQVVLFG